MTHLFLFTLTPVQSFIMQARKTQDLWAGSRMLSDLVKEAIETIQHYSHFEAKVIFPAVEGKDLEKITSLPNRLLAEFTFPANDITDTQLKEIGRSVANAISKKIGFDEKGNYNNAGFIKEAKDKIGSTEYAKIKDAFEKQLKDYFSTFWVFVPCTKETYADAYDKADRLLGAVKNSRTFTQNPEQGRKCSLSGEQNALVFNKATLPSFAINVAQIRSDMIDDKEGLAAISSIKRFYPFDKKKPFDSTTDIALLKSMQDAPKSFKDFENIFDILKAAEQEKYLKLEGKDWTVFNEQFFYEDNLTSKQIPCKQQLKIARDAHKKLREILKDKGLKFTKYYAILLFDADSMGKWLSGDFIEESKRAEQLYDFHKHISSLLSGFADYAKNYVDGKGIDNTQKGRTVYAGGDDYLGFINLHYLFDVMKHLRWEFKEQVSDKISNNKQFQIIPNPKTNSDEMSFSAGISIAHYKTPLSEVLTWARKMEKEAKDTDNKDSFGIAVLKKSGEIHKAVLNFKDAKGDCFSDNLQKILDYLSDENYSANFINVLERELSLFDKSFEYRKRIMKSEAKRLVENSRNKQKTQKAENENLVAVLDEIYDATDLRTNHKDNHFHTTLSICDFINRKLQGND